MKKELIVTSEDNNQEKLYAWIDENRGKLTFVSKDSGCGCCVSIITVEGEEKIINTIPQEILL